MRPSHTRVVQQEFLQPALLVAPTDTPDGGPIALQPRCDIVDALAASDGHDDTGMLDLEPGQATTAGNGLQDWPIRRQDTQRGSLSATHGGTSEQGPAFSIASAPNLLQDFVAGPLARRLETLLGDASLRQRMGLVGQRRFEQEFAWDVVIEKDYRSLCQENRIHH